MFAVICRQPRAWPARIRYCPRYISVDDLKEAAMPPEPAPTNQPRPALPAILAAGLVGAAALPVGRTGIGWSLTAFAVVGVIVVVARRRAPTGRADGGGAGDGAFRADMGLVALSLASGRESVREG